MALNRGKINVGGISIPAHISYGDQNPMLDAVPLTWDEGDVRYYQEVGFPATLSKTAIKYVCIAAGTPGTWVLIKTPDIQLLWEHHYRFNGVNPLVANQYTDDTWSLVGQDAWLAFTGPDVRVIGEGGGSTRNAQPVPEGAANSGAIDLMEVNACFNANDFTPATDALQFTVVDQIGTDIAVCDPIDTHVLGTVQIYYGPPAAPVVPGMALALKLNTSLAAGVGLLNVSVKVSAYRRTLVP